MIGGFLIDNFSWQLIFDINIPVGILAMIFTIIIQAEHKSMFRRKFDFIGFASVSIFLPLILYTLSEGNAVSNSAGWHAPYILFCGAISVIALAVFITAELTIKEPLIDLKLLKNRNFGLGGVIMLFFALGMFGSTFLMPIYLQNSMGYTALQAGSVFLPVGIIQGIVAPISGRISDKLNPKLPGLVGVILLSFSFYLNTKLSFLSEMHSIMVSLYIRGFSMGLIFTSLTTVSLLEIPKEKMAQAAGIANSIRQLGGSLGVAILATLLTTRINYHVQQYGGALNNRSEIFMETSAKIKTYMQHEAGTSPSGATVQAQYLLLSNLNKQAYIQGINDDFFVACIITLLGGIPIIFLHTKKTKIKHTPSHDHT
jgi:DHA2 family multidrug resistance protein